MKRYRAVVLIVVTSVCLSGYLYLNPPFLTSPPVAMGMDGDLNVYVWRFSLSFLLIGLVPFASALLLGYQPAALGFRWNKKMFRWKFYWLLFPLFVVVIAVSSFDKNMAEFYPFSKTMLESVANGSPFFFVLHGFLYFLFYYLPWELLFRGIMVFPLISWYEGLTFSGNHANRGAVNQGLTSLRFIYGSPGAEAEQSWKNPALLAIASLQTLPTVLLHLPHPVSETMGTVAFGILAAVIVLRTRSIFPVLFLHACVGIVLDLALVIRASMGL